MQKHHPGNKNTRLLGGTPKTCSIKESDHLTIKIKALFQEHSNDEELNRELFEQTVKQVILQPDGSIKFQLLNGKIV